MIIDFDFRSLSFTTGAHAYIVNRDDTDTKQVGVIDHIMQKDHQAKHRADIDKAPEGSIVTTITKKKGPDQFKTIWVKETHVKHIPITQQMPVYTHVIKGIPVPVPAAPPPPVPPPPPPPPLPPVPPVRPVIKKVPVVKTIQIKTYKQVLTDESDPEAQVGLQEGSALYADHGDAVGHMSQDRDLGVRVFGSKWDELGGNSNLPSHRWDKKKK